MAAGALLLVGLPGLSGQTAYAGEATTPAPLVAAPELGVQFNADADGDGGQCGGATGQQWAASPDWTM